MAGLVLLLALAPFGAARAWTTSRTLWLVKAALGMVIVGLSCLFAVATWRRFRGSGSKPA